MTTLREFLKETYHLETYAEGLSFQKLRPWIVCGDGLRMSIQGSRGHYCSPRVNGYEFDSLEIGFPSEKVDEFMPYAEEADQPTDTVYAYVPIEIIEAVIEKRGGFEVVTK